MKFSKIQYIALTQNSSSYIIKLQYLWICIYYVPVLFSDVEFPAAPSEISFPSVVVAFIAISGVVSAAGLALYKKKKCKYCEQFNNYIQVN
jgi:hypothetical protein